MAVPEYWLQHGHDAACARARVEGRWTGNDASTHWKRAVSTTASVSVPVVRVSQYSPEPSPSLTHMEGDRVSSAS